MSGVDLSTYGDFEHALGYSGQIYNLANAYTTEDAPVKMGTGIFLGYGVPVIKNTDGTISKLANASDISKLAGITRRYPIRAQDSLTGNDGWRDGDCAPYLCLGYIYLILGEDVVLGDKVFFDPATDTWGKSVGIELENSYVHWDIPGSAKECAGLKLGYGL